MHPNFRIEKYKDGKFCIEMKTKKSTFLKAEKWDCIIFYHATKFPFGYSSFDSAMEYFLRIIKIDILNNSK